MVRARSGLAAGQARDRRRGIPDAAIVGLEGVSIGQLRDPGGQRRRPRWCRTAGRRGSFDYISLVDVLNDRIDVDELRGKIVLVGTTRAGPARPARDAGRPAYPGVEIHANLIAGMLDENIKHKPPYVLGAEFVLMLLLGLAMAMLAADAEPAAAAMLVTAERAARSRSAINLSLFHVRQHRAAAGLAACS